MWLWIFFFLDQPNLTKCCLLAWFFFGLLYYKEMVATKEPSLLKNITPGRANCTQAILIPNLQSIPSTCWVLAGCSASRGPSVTTVCGHLGIGFHENLPPSLCSSSVLEKLKYTLFVLTFLLLLPVWFLALGDHELPLT